MSASFQSPIADPVQASLKVFLKYQQSEPVMHATPLTER